MLIIINANDNNLFLYTKDTDKGTLVKYTERP